MAVEVEWRDVFDKEFKFVDSEEKEEEEEKFGCGRVM